MLFSALASMCMGGGVVVAWVDGGGRGVRKGVRVQRQAWWMVM